MPARSSRAESALKALARHYLQKGYMRRRNPDRLAQDGPQVYKKGDEIRFVADSLKELAEIRRLLHAAGIKVAAPFRKARQYRQPVYGREAVVAILAAATKLALASSGRYR
jgi:hypothetical protein